MNIELREAIVRDIKAGSPFDEAAMLNGIDPGAIQICIDAHERQVLTPAHRSAGAAFLKARAQAVKNTRAKLFQLGEDAGDSKAMAAAMEMRDSYVPVAYGVLTVTPASAQDREAARLAYLESIDEVEESDDFEDEEFDEDEYEKKWHE